MLAFPNGFDYRNFDSKTFNANIFSTYSANLIKIGPVTPEITKAKTTLFDKMAKISISYQISQHVRD